MQKATPFKRTDQNDHVEESLRKKKKLTNRDPLCHPRLYGWYTLHALQNLLGEDIAKTKANIAPKRWAGQGHGKPCIQQFLITDGEDAFKVYFEQFYVPPPPRGL